MESSLWRMTEEECGNSPHLTPYSGLWVRRRVPGCDCLVITCTFNAHPCSGKSSEALARAAWQDSPGFNLLRMCTRRHHTLHLPEKTKNPANKGDRNERSILLNIYCWVMYYLLGDSMGEQSDVGNVDLCSNWCDTSHSWPICVVNALYEYKKILSSQNIVAIIWYMHSPSISSLSFNVYRIQLF